VYGRAEDAEITYCKSMTVQDYLDMTLANDAVRELILKHLTKLEQILSDDARVVEERNKVLNKFYQCLVACRICHKKFESWFSLGPRTLARLHTG
jgi:hypothetical protein